MDKKSTNSTKAINEDVIPAKERNVFDSLDEQGQAEFFGFGPGTRNAFDVPAYI